MCQVSSVFIEHAYCRHPVCKLLSQLYQSSHLFYLAFSAWQYNSSWILVLFVASPEFHYLHSEKQFTVLYTKKKYKDFCSHMFSNLCSTVIQKSNKINLHRETLRDIYMWDGGIQLLGGVFFSLNQWIYS